MSDYTHLPPPENNPNPPAPSGDKPTAPPVWLGQPSGETGQGAKEVPVLQRPKMATVLCVIYTVLAAISTIGAIGVLALSDELGEELETQLDAPSWVLTALLAMLVVSAFFSVAASLGLWSRKSWAWKLSIALAGILLIQNVATGNLISAVSQGVVLYIALRPEVRGWYSPQGSVR